MKTQAIAFDLDDTLVREDRTISDDTVAVLRRASAQGIHILPASGRARDSMRPFVERIGCAECYISCNGAEVWDAKTHALLKRETLPVALAREVAEFAEDRDCYAQTYSETGFFYSREGEYARAYAESAMLTGKYVGDLAAFITVPTTKILMMDEPGKIAHMLAEARERFSGRAAVTCSKPYFLEINPLRATKGIALQWCGDHLGFALENAVAFGDSLNDLSMLEAAGLGIAMGNARDDVKCRVHTVCLTNEEDGVARYIDQYLLREEHA